MAKPPSALASHRYAEVSQFTRIAQAAACVFPERHGDFSFAPMIARVKAENSCLRFPIVLRFSRLLPAEPGVAEPHEGAPARAPRRHGAQARSAGARCGVDP